MSVIRFLKWLLVSLNTEKLGTDSADVANIRKIVMFGKESGSADTTNFMKVSGKSALSDCLDHILNYLDTSLSNDFGLTIKDGIRLSKVLAGWQLSAEKWFCNCCSNISIKGMPICL